jgi:hypothetical protein
MRNSDMRICRRSGNGGEGAPARDRGRRVGLARLIRRRRARTGKSERPGIGEYWKDTRMGRYGEKGSQDRAERCESLHFAVVVPNRFNVIAIRIQ